MLSFVNYLLLYHLIICYIFGVSYFTYRRDLLSEDPT